MKTAKQIVNESKEAAVRLMQSWQHLSDEDKKVLTIQFETLALLIKSTNKP